MRIEFNKIYDVIRDLVLFSYLYDEIGNRIKYVKKVEKVVLQIVLIIILQKSEVIHIILYLLKKY